jgi:hypothetical protein
MSSLAQNLASMVAFTQRGKVREVTDPTDRKHLLTLATETVLGKNPNLDSFLIPALTLIPSTDIDSIINLLEGIIKEYKSLLSQQEVVTIEVINVEQSEVEP